MIRRRPRLILLLALAALRSAAGAAAREVVVYLSIDQVFTEPILRDFERQSGVKVRAVFDTEETKSTGVLNRIVAEAASPQADVFWSGDPVRPLPAREARPGAPVRIAERRRRPARVQGRRTEAGRAAPRGRASSS